MIVLQQSYRTKRTHTEQIAGVELEKLAGARLPVPQR